MLQTAVTPEGARSRIQPMELDAHTAAAQLGLTASQVTRLLRGGRLAGRQLPGSTWLAQAASVSEYAAGRDQGPVRAAQLEAMETLAAIQAKLPPQTESG